MRKTEKSSPSFSKTERQLSQIAEKVGMSAIDVKKRLDKLEKGKIKLTP